MGVHVVVEELAVGVSDVFGQRITGDGFRRRFGQFQLAGDGLDELR